VSIIDIHDPTNPRIIANLPLMNSVMGPPVNLAITPDSAFGAGCQFARLGQRWRGLEGCSGQQDLCIDLTTSPPVQIATVEAG